MQPAGLTSNEQALRVRLLFSLEYSDFHNINSSLSGSMSARAARRESKNKHLCHAGALQVTCSWEVLCCAVLRGPCHGTFPWVTVAFGVKLSYKCLWKLDCPQLGTSHFEKLQICYRSYRSHLIELSSRLPQQHLKTWKHNNAHQPHKWPLTCEQD